MARDAPPAEAAVAGADAPAPPQLDGSSAAAAAPSQQAPLAQQPPEQLLPRPASRPPPPPRGRSTVEEEDDDVVVEMDPSGRYGRYGTVVGSGRFKTVYRGFDERAGIDVAWSKVGAAANGLDAAGRARVAAEMAIGLELDHPNIIRSYKCWESPPAGPGSCCAWCRWIAWAAATTGRTMHEIDRAARETKRVGLKNKKNDNGTSLQARAQFRASSLSPHPSGFS
jgi:hypothetical protein